MNIKTAQSFFPTNVKASKGSNKEKYIVIRQINKEGKTVEEVNKKTMNMFSDIPSNKFYSFNQQTEKPVGGLATFMREDKRKNKSKYPVHLPSQKNEFRNEGKKEKQIKAQRTNQKLQKQHTEQQVNERQQIFKEHKNYSEDLNKRKQHKRPATCGSRSIKQQKHGQWVNSQCKSKHNRMAFLNEIYYKKPLNERYGDRYFEYILRDRYEQDLPPPSYVYKIEKETHKQVEKDKFLTKILNQNQKLQNRHPLVIKGTKYIYD